MGLFDTKKKNDSLKTLSEIEIQSRLYGGLRKPHQLEKNEPRQNGHNSAVLNTKDPDPAAAERELFHSTDPKSAEKVLDPAPVETHTPQREKIHHFLKQESQTIQKNLRQTYVSKIYPDTTKEPIARSKYASNPGPSVAAKMTAFAKQSAGAAFTASVSFVQSKSKSPQFLSLIGALALIGLLIVGVQGLNTQREKAMKDSMNNPGKALMKLKEKQKIREEAKAKKAADIEKSAAVGSSAAQPLVKPSEPAAVSAPQVSATEPVTPAGAATSLADEQPYVIQVATYVGPNDAMKMVNTLKDAGLPAFVKPLQRMNGKIYHCVFIGRYATYADAEIALLNFKKNTLAQSFQDAFIRSLKRS